MNFSQNDREDHREIGDDSTDLLLAEVVDEFTTRLQEGELVEDVAKDLGRRYPALAPAITDLVPTIASLASISQNSRDGINPLAEEIDRPGERTIDAYRLIQRIGQGGMGVVYEAHDLALNRRIALKVLRGSAALDTRSLQRFQVEAQAASWLSHPHIVPVHAIGQAEDIAYYTMPLIDGASLDRVIACLRARIKNPEQPSQSRASISIEQELARGLISGKFDAEITNTESTSDPMNLRTPAVDPSTPSSGTGQNRQLSTIGKRSYIRCVAALGIQVAEALHHAHETGILHRDIKPGNLLLDRRGNLWITDFGLARLPDSRNEMTYSGERPGTLRYMSPEQAAGDSARVDRRTDLYALGASLYELLTLNPVITGSEPQTILRELLEAEPIPATWHNAAIPRDLSTILTKTIARDPAHRYDTGRELAEDLRRFLAGEPVAARPVSWPARTMAWVQRKPVIAALCVLLFGTLVAGVGGITYALRTAVAERDQKTEAQRITQAALARAEKAQDAALQASNEINAVYKFLRDQFLTTSGPFSHDTNPSMKLDEALNKAAEKVATFETSPQLMALLDSDFGQAFHDLGVFDRSAYHLDRAWSTLQQSPEEFSETGNLIRIRRGHNLLHLGQFAESEQVLRETLHRLKESDKPASLELLVCKKYLSETLMAAGKLDDSEAIQLEILQELETPRPTNMNYRDMVSDIRIRLADIQQARGNLNEAIRLLQEHEASIRADSPLELKNLLNCRNNLGAMLQVAGRLNEAETIFREDLESYPMVFSTSVYKKQMITLNLAKVLFRQKKLTESEVFARQAMTLAVNSPTIPLANRTDTRMFLSQVLFEQGHHVEAVDLVQQILQEQRSLLGPMHKATRFTESIFERLRNSDGYRQSLEK